MSDSDGKKVKKLRTYEDDLARAKKQSETKKKEEQKAARAQEAAAASDTNPSDDAATDAQTQNLSQSTSQGDSTKDNKQPTPSSPPPKRKMIDASKDLKEAKQESLEDKSAEDRARDLLNAQRSYRDPTQEPTQPEAPPKAPEPEPVEPTPVPAPPPPRPLEPIPLAKSEQPPESHQKSELANEPEMKTVQSGRENQTSILTDGPKTFDVNQHLESHEEGTIISDTKQHRWRLLPAIGHAIAGWFKSKKDAYEESQAPAHTVEDPATRKELIKRSVSRKTDSSRAAVNVGARLLKNDGPPIAKTDEIAVKDKEEVAPAGWTYVEDESDQDANDDQKSDTKTVEEEDKVAASILPPIKDTKEGTSGGWATASPEAKNETLGGATEPVEKKSVDTTPGAKPSAKFAPASAEAKTTRVVDDKPRWGSAVEEPTDEEETKKAKSQFFPSSISHKKVQSKEATQTPQEKVESQQKADATAPEHKDHTTAPVDSKPDTKASRQEPSAWTPPTQTRVVRAAVPQDHTAVNTQAPRAAQYAPKDTPGETRESSKRSEKESGEKKERTFSATFFLNAAVAVLLGVGVAYWWFTRTPEPTVGEAVSVASLVEADTREAILFTEERFSLFATIDTNIETRTDVTEFYFTESLDETTTIETDALLDVLAFQAPGSFARTIQDVSFGSNEGSPFIVLKVQSFEIAFSGILSWENSMSADLAPIFGEPVRETFDPTARTSGQTRQAFFRDIIIENDSARVLRDAKNDERIVYGFVDPNTILITTNEEEYLALLPRLR